MRLRKTPITLCIYLMIAMEIYTQENPNYMNQNGTIIIRTQEHGLVITIRRHNQDVIIGDLATEDERKVYDNYINGRKIGDLAENDQINITEICTIENQSTGKKENWYHITKDNIAGWIRDDYSDPYKNNAWSIIETITSSVKKWTVRKLEQTVSIWEVLNVRDKPGVTGTNVIFQIKPGITDPVQTNVHTLAITEEDDLIDGKKDYWLKIDYNGELGWIYGGYASVERGGPKYYIPEYVIEFALGWY